MPSARKYGVLLPMQCDQLLPTRLEMNPTKVLLDHPNPFLLAHGGFQTQIEQTKNALNASGVEAEYLRWWDDSQKSEIIHYFGRPQSSYVELAQNKGIRFVMGELLTGLGSRSARARFAQQFTIRAARSIFPREMTARMGWNCYQNADAVIALTEWERQLMVSVFGAREERVHVVPNGVEREFFEAPSQRREPWLVCTATIAERKRVLELAQACVIANTPIWIVGKPYSPNDSYARAFIDFTAKHAGLVRYQGGISNRAELANIYRKARGFVLLSTMESLSLSALEAAACECPLLLSDLPWAKWSFRTGVEFCPISPPSTTANYLRQFYDAAPSMPYPDRPLSWIEIGARLASIYRTLL